VSREEYGIVILLDNLGTRNRMTNDLNSFLDDWDTVLTRAEQNISRLEDRLSGTFRTGIRMKDIFDNIQIFFPTDDPATPYLDLTGSNSIWWSLQHSADLLINLVRFALTKGIFLRGGISMGPIREFRSGYFSQAMIENSDLMDGFPMIGVRAGLSAIRVLNNKSYQSSPRFYFFVKYQMPTDTSNSSSWNALQPSVLVNLPSESTLFDNVSDQEVNDIISKEIESQSGAILKKWENTRNFIHFIQTVSNESNFL
jgi:hypothetical protein